MNIKTLRDLLASNRDNSRAIDLIDKYLLYSKEHFLNLIEYMDLSSCELHEIGTWISQFRGLRHLCLINNNLTDLPIELSNIKTLCIIELQQTNLKSIPNVLYNIPSLHSIFLNNNPIKELPISLVKIIREPYPYKSIWKDY